MKLSTNQRMSLLCTFFVLLLLPGVLAEELPRYYEYDSLTIEGSIENPIQIVGTSAKSSIERVDASILWYPKEAEITTEPSSTREGEIIFFALNNPVEGDYVFTTKFNLENTVDQPQISPTPFPLKKLPSNLAKYVLPGEIIDTNDEIKALASSLSVGDDEFEIVVNLAKWVKENVKYDLSTQAVEASQSSSWVLENRRGVCDELTNLFISLARSLGIPARFASGLSYTTSNSFSEHWGPHGWAEVYFPSEGWVPFDVTYGQLGWTDATHILFTTGVDSEEGANSYSWRGRNTDVLPQSMNYHVNVLRTGEKLRSPLAVQVLLAEDEVGDDSYNVVIAKINNRGNSMLAEDVMLGQTQGLQIISPAAQVVSLAPQESKNLFWLIKVTEEIKHNYEYRFPVIVYTSRGINDTETLYGQSQYQTTSKTWAENYIERFGFEKEQGQTTGLVCTTPATSVRVGQAYPITCQTQEKLCVEEECVEAQNGQATIELTFDEEALHAVVLTSGEEKTFIQVSATQEPLLLITHVQSPEKIDYDARAPLSFSVVQEAGMPLTSLDVIVSSAVTKNKWHFETAEQRDFSIDIDGNTLTENPTEYVIRAEYLDDKGNEQSIQETILIRQGKIAWWQKVMLWLSKLTT